MYHRGGYVTTDSDGISQPASAQKSEHTSNGRSAPQYLPNRRKIKKKAFKSHHRRDFSAGSILILLFAGVALAGCALTVMLRLWSFSSRFISGDGDVSFYKHNIPSSGDGAEDYDYDRFEELDWNPIYRVKESIPIVGDRSDAYAKLRREVDALLPDNPARSLERVKELIKHHFQVHPQRDLEEFHVDGADKSNVPYVEEYDIYNCPEEPPHGYPYQWNLLGILKAWPVEDPTPPTHLHQGLCVFDYTKDFDKAMTYREAEVPFIIENDPEVAKAVERLNMPTYIDRLMGDVMHRAEYSRNVHFMYYNAPPKAGKRRAPEFKDWVKPTEHIRMTYADWFRHASVTDETLLGPHKPHWYYRLIGCGLTGNDGSCDKGSSEYLFDELPFFQPKKNLYMVEPMKQKGIHCRFGMKGVMAENHFDASRNSIVLLGGSRRYILSHPDQCSNLALYPKGHPSARHSEVNWGEPDIEKFPAFAAARSNEVVLQAGQILYLPTFWFHQITSLDVNYQCNARSGVTFDYKSHIAECKFY